MGIVYLAQQSEPVPRKVALKVIKPGMDSRQVIARFEAERQALAMMEHPNIAKVLDAGTTESGLPYFVMELVRGIAITEYCDRSKMSIEERLRLLCDACRAIQHAHNKGIIHRDIKPSNVLITEHDGTPVLKVIDFGVAKALTDNLTEKTLFTGIFQMIGTPLYMSPEQASLSNLDVDVRSDVFSLGVLLYEMVSGAMPIDRETAKQLSFEELRQRICDTEPLRPSRRLSTLKEDGVTIAENRRVDPKTMTRLLSGELDRIVMKAIAKDRTQRYQSARELGDDIGRFLAGDAVEACPPSIAYRLRKQIRRHRVAVTVLFFVVMATLVAIIGTTSQMIRATRAERESSSRLVALTTEQAKTEKALDVARSAEAAQRLLRQKAETSERESKWSLYVAQLYPMRQALAEREYGRLQSLLDESVPKEGEPDFRGWEWYYLQDQVRGATKRITMEGIRGSGLAWSEKRRLLAIPMLEKGIISILDGDTLEMKSVLGVDRRVHELAFSPLGNQLAIGTAYKQVLVVDVDSPYQQTVYRPFDDSEIKGGIGGNVHVGWSADEKHLGAALRTGDVAVIHTDEGTFESVRRPKGNVSVDLHWHPSKPWIAVGHRWGERRIYDVEKSTDWQLSRDSVAYGEAIRWSPTGKWLATSEDSELRIADSEFNNHAILKGHSSPINHIRWIDDTTVASAAQDHTIRIWNVQTKTLVNVIQIHDVGVGSLEIDVDRGRVFSGDRYENVIVSELRPRETYQANRMDTSNASRLIPSSDDFYSEKNSITALQWSPDGTQLAAESEVENQLRWSGDCAIFHPDTARQVSSWETGLCKGMSWSPDGLAVYRMATYSSFKIDDPISGKTQESTERSSGSEPIAFWSPDRSLVVRNVHEKPMVLHAHTLELDSRFAADQSRFVSNSSLRSGAWNRSGNRFVGVGYGAGHLMTDSADVIELPYGVHGADSSFACAWHPSGRLFVVGNRLGKINLFESERGQLLMNFGTHAGIVTGLDFSPDGRRLASCASDGTVGIWDTATGSELLVLTVPGIPRLSQIQWSPDGLQLAAGTGNQGIVVWGRSSQQPVPRSATFLQTGSVLKTLDDPDIQSRWVEHVDPLAWRKWYVQMVDTVGQPDEPFSSSLSESLQSIGGASIEVRQWEHFMIAGRAYVDAFSDPQQAIRMVDALTELIEQKSGNRSDRLREKMRLAFAKVNRLISLGRYSNALQAVDQNVLIAEKLVKLSDATKHDWRLWRTAQIQKVDVIARAYESTFSNDADKQKTLESQRNSESWVDQLKAALLELEKNMARFPHSARWIESDGAEDFASWSARLLDRTVEKEIAITSSSRLLHQWAPRWNSPHYRDRYYRAICHAGSGDADAFRAICKGMIEDFSKSKEYYELSDTAWTCALIPDALDDYEVPIEMAKAALQIKPDSLASKDTLAALLVRAGKFDEAIESFESILEEEQDEFSNDTIWAFLAMAEMGRGNFEASRRWMNRADEYTTQLLQQESDAKLTLTWHRRLLLHLLHDEARSRFQAATLQE